MSNLNGKISLQSFCVGLTFCVTASLLILNSRYFEKYIYYLGIVHFLACLSILCLKFSGNFLRVALCAFCLGYGFAVGLLMTCLANETWTVFGWYLCVLTFFHYSEYYVISIANPRSLSLDSFLINHSHQYYVALICSWLEFVIERYLFPGMKILWLSWIGLFFCIGGEVIRILAMLTAHSNFNHVIQIQREEGHVLVTHGIYKWTRHPAYLGYFWWSIGTQIILCNPVCVVGYALVVWNFFSVRILEEEITLLNFFGEDYVHYQRRVGTLLPFIKGYRLEL